MRCPSRWILANIKKSQRRVKSKTENPYPRQTKSHSVLVPTGHIGGGASGNGLPQGPYTITVRQFSNPHMVKLYPPTGNAGSTIPERQAVGGRPLPPAGLMLRRDRSSAPIEASAVNPGIFMSFTSFNVVVYLSALPEFLAVSRADPPGVPIPGRFAHPRNKNSKYATEEESTYIPAALAVWAAAPPPTIAV